MTAMAFAVGFAIVAIVAVSRTLPAAIAMGLATTAPAQDSGWLIIVHSPPTGVIRGVQLSLLGLLLGGVPAAIRSNSLGGLARPVRTPMVSRLVERISRWVRVSTKQSRAVGLPAPGSVLDCPGSHDQRGFPAERRTAHSERRVQYVGPPHVETVASRDVQMRRRSSCGYC